MSIFYLADYFVSNFSFIKNVIKIRTKSKKNVIHLRNYISFFANMMKEKIGLN